jgi:anti-anti-sigma factor
MVQEQEARSNPEGYVGDSMSFHINTEQIGDVAVLQCAGRMVRAQALSLLNDSVTCLSRLRVIVLDLSEVEMLDAGGLGVLVSSHNWACAKGIQLKLVNPSKQAREMLELTGLASVLHVSSVEDVIQIFCSSDRATENVDRAVA